MKPLPILCILGLLTAVAFPVFRKSAAVAEALPAAPVPVAATVDATGYAPLTMEEIFKSPAGPKGLEYSERAKALDGAKVSVHGYMVRHAHADPRVFLFAPQRMVLFQAEFGTADDLPPYALHVITANAPEGKAARYLREELRLLGTLQLGPRQEVDGRISQVRLILDHVTSPEGTVEIPILASLALQPERLVNAIRENPSPDPSRTVP